MAPSGKRKFGRPPSFTVGADRLPVYDDTTGLLRDAVISTGLNYDTATNVLTSSGGTNVLLIGQAGGNTIIFGTNNGDNGSITATSGGQGKILFSNMVWYEAGSSFTVGSTTVGAEHFNVHISDNGFGGMSLVNSSAGTSKATVFYHNTTTSYSGPGAEIAAFPANYTTAALQSKYRIMARNTTGFILDTDIGAPMIFMIGSTEILRYATQTITINDNGTNFIFGTTSGSKLGTAANQKVSTYGATPVVQAVATTDLGVVLSNFGVRAAGTAYPITTSGAVTLGSLTSGRIPIASTAGLLTDDADLTFVTDTLSATKITVKAGTSSGNVARVGGNLFDHFVDATVGGAEADIYTDTTIANTFGTNGDKVIASYGGNFVTVGTELCQLKVYFAGTAIWDSTGVAPTTGTTSWRVYVELIRVSATVIRYTVALNTTGASGFVYCNVGELTALTLSGTNILKITGTSTGVGSGAGDIVGKMGYVEYIAFA